jgi:hypothetical protein
MSHSFGFIAEQSLQLETAHSEHVPLLFIWKGDVHLHEAAVQTGVE